MQIFYIHCLCCNNPSTIGQPINIIYTRNICKSFIYWITSLYVYIIEMRKNIIYVPTFFAVITSHLMEDTHIYLYGVFLW